MKREPNSKSWITALRTYVLWIVSVLGKCIPSAVCAFLKLKPDIVHPSQPKGRHSLTAIFEFFQSSTMRTASHLTEKIKLPSVIDCRAVVQNFELGSRALILFFSLAIALLMGPGCTVLPKHTKSDVWKTRVPNIKIASSNIDIKNAKPSGDYKDYQKDFEAQYKELMATKGIMVQGEPVDLDVSLNYEGGISTFGQYIMCVITTPLIFLVFNSNAHKVPYIIDYSVKEPSGRSIIHNRLKGRVQGAFRGWSFFRLLSRSKLWEEQGQFFAKEAAIVVFNDVAKQWNNEGSSSKSAGAPEPDYRAQARKIMRVEQLLKEAKEIYPEGKEIPKLEKRLDRVKKSL